MEQLKTIFQIHGKKIVVIILVLVIVTLGIMLLVPSKKDPLTSDESAGTTVKTINALEKEYISLAKTSPTSSELTLYGTLTNIKQDKGLVSYVINVGRGIVSADYHTITVPLTKLTTPPTFQLPQDIMLIFQCKNSSKDQEVCDPVTWKITALETKPTTQADLLSAGKRVNQWLTNQKNTKNGIYTSGSTCDIHGKCQNTDIALSDGLVHLWGKYQNYKALTALNPQEANLLLRDLESDFKNYNAFVTASSGIQFQFFNCTYMYDMWKDTSLPQAIRDGALEMCTLTFNLEETPTVDTATYINQLPTILQTKETFVNLKTISSGFKLEQAATRTSHYAIRHLFSQEVDFRPKFHTLDGIVKIDNLERAKIWYAEGLRLYQQENTTLFTDATCQLGTASIDMYRASSETQYLTFAQTLLNKLNLVEECASETSQSSCQRLLYQQAVCAEFAYRMYQETRQQSYQQIAGAIIADAQNSFLDNKEYPGVITNDGAFFIARESSSPEQGKIMKTTLINGLMLGIISQFAMNQ